MMSNSKQFAIVDTLCNKICNEPKIRFCGVINAMGRLVSGSFKDGIMPLDTDQQRQMLYMQSKLELSMKSEFNANLGHVNYILTYRDNLVIINIPIKNQEYHILISAERIADVQKIAENVINLFEDESIFSNKNINQNSMTEKNDLTIKN